MTKCVPGHFNGTVVSTLIPFEAYGICAIKNKSFVVVEIIHIRRPSLWSSSQRTSKHKLT